MLLSNIHLLFSLVVIKLEGGTESDLAVLDRPPSPLPEEQRHSSSNPVMSPREDDVADSSADSQKEGNVAPSTGMQSTLKDNDRGVYSESVVNHLFKRRP